MSQFKNYTDGIMIRGMPLSIVYPGNVYWVDSGGGGSTKGTFESPAATIAVAAGLCEGSNSDIIICKPGHVEYMSEDGALDLHKNGIAIVGTGAGSNQSKIVFDTADTASIDITAANISFINMWFEADFVMIDGAIDVESSGDYFSVIGCRVTSSSAATEFESFINIAVGANYFSFIGNDVVQILGTSAEDLVHTVGESLGMRVMDNRIIMEASVAIFDIDATALTGGPLFRNNRMLNLTAAANYCVDINAATVAFFVDERYACDGADEPLFDSTAAFGVGCMGVDENNTGSLAFPKTATAW
jgi:hypothetical protein